MVSVNRLFLIIARHFSKFSGRAARRSQQITRKEAIKRRDHGDETLADIRRGYNVSGWTISRLSAG